jgi:uncharacterized protein (DUF2164 family)
MSKERELLFYGLLNDDVNRQLVKETKELLAQPKREPLSDEEVVQLINTKHFDTSYTLKQSDEINLKWYKQGIKDAETHHKIWSR